MWRLYDIDLVVKDDISAIWCSCEPRRAYGGIARFKTTTYILWEPDIKNYLRKAAEGKIHAKHIEKRIIISDDRRGVVLKLAEYGKNIVFVLYGVISTGKQRRAVPLPSCIHDSGQEIPPYVKINIVLNDELREATRTVINTALRKERLDKETFYGIISNEILSATIDMVEQFIKASAKKKHRVSSEILNARLARRMLKHGLPLSFRDGETILYIT